MPHFHTQLAKKAVEHYLKTGQLMPVPDNTPPELLKKRLGAFVSIMQKPDKKTKPILRGCIGTYLPTKVNIAEEIIGNAVAAAKDDYRFEPIRPAELDSLSYVVYIIHDPHQISDLNQLNPKKFGLLVKTTPFTYPNQKPPDGNQPFKSGLLLPGLDDVENANQQFTLACRKAGINPAKEKVYLYRFTVEKYL